MVGDVSTAARQRLNRAAVDIPKRAETVHDSKTKSCHTAAHCLNDSGLQLPLSVLLLVSHRTCQL
jgi:hypothetical protein